MADATPQTLTQAPDQPDEKPRFFGLSLTQIAGSALAAVTTAVAASFFGVAGTLIGAAFGSVVSTVAGAAYASSLQNAATRLRPRTLLVRPPAPRWSRLRWRPVAAVAALGFAVALAGLTLTESALGHPVSDSAAAGTTLGQVAGTAPDDAQDPGATDPGEPAPQESDGPAGPTPEPGATDPVTTDPADPSDPAGTPSVPAPDPTGTPTTDPSAPAPAPTDVPPAGDAASPAPTGGAGG